MKILSNFDTKLGKKIFFKRIEEYWDWNVLLVKRHPLFLYKAFINWIIAILLFIALVWILYMEYSKNIEYFYTFTILHLLWIGIWVITLFKKIISNLWSYKEFIQKKDDFKDIELWNFWKFFKYSIVLFIYQFIISIIDMVTIMNLYDNWWLSIWWWITMLIINILFLLLIIKILRRFVDFEMDFIVVTPDEIESINQTWFFKREVVSLDIKKVRSISTEKDGFFRSLFNIWWLVILAEWNSENHGEIRFNYINRLWKLKKSLLKLLCMDKKWNKIDD